MKARTKSPRARESALKPLPADAVLSNWRVQKIMGIPVIYATRTDGSYLAAVMSIEDLRRYPDIPSDIVCEYLRRMRDRGV